MVTCPWPHSLDPIMSLFYQKFVAKLVLQRVTFLFEYINTIVISGARDDVITGFGISIQHDKYRLIFH